MDVTTESEYSHETEMDRLDTMQKTLTDLQSDLVKQSVRCHLLQVDLATQYSPHTVQAANSATDECTKCSSRLDLLKTEVTSTNLNSNLLDNANGN